jgi:hypothetical protein
MCVCGLTSITQARTAPPAFVPTASLQQVTAIGLTAGALPVYVATEQGLFRSSAPRLESWERTSVLTDIASLSPNPQHSDDLVYAVPWYRGPTPPGIYRSTDGGHTATRVDSGISVSNFTRSPTAPSIIYATGDISYTLTVAVLRSMDDGQTWQIVNTFVPDYDDAGFDAIVVDPRDALHLAARVGLGHRTYVVDESHDGGHTWVTTQDPNYGQETYYGILIDLAFTYTRPSDLWAVWEGGQLDRNALPISNSLLTTLALSPTLATPQALLIDPLSSRVYLQVYARDQPASVYALDLADPTLAYTLTLPFTVSSGTPLGITRSGYLLSAHRLPPYGFPYSHPYSRGQLSVVPLIAARVWPVASRLRASPLAVGPRSLGASISPPTLCQGQPCQYFVKGALARNTRGRVAPIALVTDMLGQRAALPVGGSPSTLTYGTLQALHARRMLPPRTFRGSTAPVRGGTFVPYDSRLRPAPGYVVPPVFWHYVTDRSHTPDGWQTDVGLPLTPAVAATVTKGRLGVRRIMVQAFAKAVLTYDPKNAAGFQVERANVGVDYAVAFPTAVH